MTRKKKPQPGEIVPDTWQHYRYAAAGGALACGLTRTLACPIDHVRCRMQNEPQKYKSLSQGLKYSMKQGSGLYKTWAPTLFGNGLKGAVLFSGYEYFKLRYAERWGAENAYTYRTLVYLQAGASAAVLASIAFAPFETMRMQAQCAVKPPPSPCYCYPCCPPPPPLPPASIFRGFLPLLCRQVPYSMMKLAFFDRILECLYRDWVPKTREQCTTRQQLLLTFIAGSFAGALAAIVSQPFDSLLSRFHQNSGTSIKGLLQQTNIAGLYRGLGAAMLALAPIVGMKWLIYDAFRMFNNVPRPPPPEMPASMKKKQKKEPKPKAEKKKKTKG